MRGFYESNALLAALIRVDRAHIRARILVRFLSFSLRVGKQSAFSKNDQRPA